VTTDPRAAATPDRASTEPGTRRPLAATYDIAGPIGGTPIVFVHGTRLSRSMWQAQVDRLADTFRVITLDLPGHGALADEPFSLDAAVEHVAAVIDEAAAGRAVVVGLSLGGYVAMMVGGRHPERVSGLVLAGATAEPVGLRAMPYRGLGWAMARFDGERLMWLNRRFFQVRYPPEIAGPIVTGGFWSRGGAEALRALLGASFLPSLRAYPGPTLIVNGEYDVLFRWSAPLFAAAARDARRVILAGATHLSNLDRPAAFSTAVRRFAAPLAPPR
jgi:pimeloyl-ACP methyl ester carboxylesterase